eukprot:gene16338-25040_t
MKKLMKMRKKELMAENQETKAEAETLEKEMVQKALEGALQDGTAQKVSFSFGEYEGELQEGKLHGRGCFTWTKTGVVYKGNWVDGARHGKGELADPINGESEHVYRGDWIDDQKHGKGYYECPEHSYDGEWKNDCMHGHGVLKFCNGDTYDGSFVNDVEHGQGKYTYADAGFYEGGYREGVRQGKGVFVTKKGD